MVWLIDSLPSTAKEWLAPDSREQVHRYFWDPLATLPSVTATSPPSSVPSSNHLMAPSRMRAQLVSMAMIFLSGFIFLKIVRSDQSACKKEPQAASQTSLLTWPAIPYRCLLKLCTGNYLVGSLPGATTHEPQWLPNNVLIEGWVARPDFILSVHPA